MTASVTALFDTAVEAEAAAARLAGLGEGLQQVTIAHPLPAGDAAGEGVFDRLAGMIAPEAARGAPYQLTARVAPERVEEAAKLLENRRIVLRSWAGAGDGAAAALAGRSWEFAETEERLEVASRAVVREEVVIRREAGEHVEQIDETVRRTRVEVEELPSRR
jgi:hypothetical protein